MGAVINLLVPVFHVAVFSGLAYWMSGSERFKSRPRPAAFWFIVGGVLANLILCAMLFELYSGISMVTGNGHGYDDNFLAKNMKTALLAQPVFALLMYPVLMNIFSLRLKTRAQSARA